MSKEYRPYKDREWMHEMYYDRQMEVWEIALCGDTTVKMIHEWLQRFEFYSMDEEEFVDIY